MLHSATLPFSSMPMLKDEWLTAAAAARLLGIHRVTFYDWLEAGKLASVRTLQPGGKGRILYSRSDLVKLVTPDEA